MNGWYVVYLLMIVVNSVMCTAHGYSFKTWQNWVWFGTVVVAFMAGRNYGA